MRKNYPASGMEGLAASFASAMSALSDDGAMIASDTLMPLTDFGVNPGGLSAFHHVPADLPTDAPLVVVLHGCTQNAAGFDRASGWSRLAERDGFALLFPEQTRSNNPNLCFNWFQPKDTTRDQGEVASIAQMIASMRDQHGIDPSRIHITGLSAGGAMAASMLAAYPELFASGAIIAGLPHGIARNVPQALDAMAGRLPLDHDLLAERVRSASDHGGPWPRVSVWQGDADHTVVALNGAAVAAQWRSVHGLGDNAAATQEADGHRRTVWVDQSGHPVVELNEIAQMGHGVPLRPGQGADEAGQAAPHMLDVGVNSTGRIAAFFGITPLSASAKMRMAEPLRAHRSPPKRTADVIRMGRPSPAQAEAKSADAPSGVQAVIEKALRAAGLM